MYLDAYKARLLLETESEEDSVLINKNVENRQTASGVKVLKKNWLHGKTFIQKDLRELKDLKRLGSDSATLTYFQHFTHLKLS